MRRRKTLGLGIWTIFSKAAKKNSKRVQRAVGKAVVKSAVKQANAVGKATLQALSGVASPAPAPSNRGAGKWEEGRWGQGPLIMRDYRLFIPPGVSTSRPAPLLVLLHGCGQDSASFAACTRIAAIARAERCIALLPEQSSQANAQRCWNWFRSKARVAAEAMLLMTIVEHVCQLHAVRRDLVFVMGMSAGGSMAMTLALRFPARFAAVAAHSSAVPHSADNVMQAAQTMQGHRLPDTEALRLTLAGRRLPPLLVLHGDADHVVSFNNALASAALWIDLLSDNASKASTREVQRGVRRSHTISDWKVNAKPYVRFVRVVGLDHAWSGGAPKQAFSDPSGPDALKIALRFFAESTSNWCKNGSALEKV
jgi:poly(3-hydroxybutyrate) depolymerase